MTTPINLNKQRKNKARAAKKARANENAARFGRSKSERTTQQANDAKVTTLWAAHRVEDDDSASD